MKDPEAPEAPEAAKELRAVLGPSEPWAEALGPWAALGPAGKGGRKESRSQSNKSHTSSNKTAPLVVAEVVVVGGGGGGAQALAVARLSADAIPTVATVLISKDLQE